MRTDYAYEKYWIFCSNNNSYYNVLRIKFETMKNAESFEIAFNNLPFNNILIRINQLH